MNALWIPGAVGPVLAPLLVCAALVLSSMAWVLTTRNAPVSHPSPPETANGGASAGVRFSLPLLFVGLSALAVVVSLVLLRGSMPPSTDPRPTLNAVMALLAIALAAVGGSPFTTSILSLAMRAPAGENGGIVVTAAPKDATVQQTARTTEVLRGGTTIGVLERIAAVGTIIAGFPEGIAIIVALKGVGRFTELATSEAKERFIIGSLASLLWACACAFLVR